MLLSQQIRGWLYYRAKKRYPNLATDGQDVSETLAKLEEELVDAEGVSKPAKRRLTGRQFYWKRIWEGDIQAAGIKAWRASPEFQRDQAFEAAKKDHAERYEDWLKAKAKAEKNGVAVPPEPVLDEETKNHKNGRLAFLTAYFNQHHWNILTDEERRHWEDQAQATHDETKKKYTEVKEKVMTLTPEQDSPASLQR